MPVHALGKTGVCSFKMGFEEGQDAGHGGEDRDPLGADELDEARRRQPALKVKFSLEDGWNPEPHGLAEDVAERQRVQNAQGMDKALVAHIRLGTFFNGTHAGQHVAMGEDDAFGIAGGAGSKENLQRGLVRKA